MYEVSTVRTRYLKNSSISDEIIKYANYLFVIISLDDKKLEKYSR